MKEIIEGAKKIWEAIGRAEDQATGFLLVFMDQDFSFTGCVIWIALFAGLLIGYVF